HDGEPQPGALPRRPGGEERVEDLLPVLGRHTGTGVSDEQQSPWQAGRKLAARGATRGGSGKRDSAVIARALASGPTWLVGPASCAKYDHAPPSPGTGRVHGVEEQVHERLLEQLP